MNASRESEKTNAPSASPSPPASKEDAARRLRDLENRYRGWTSKITSAAMIRFILLGERSPR
jgi:hypothetical protein